VTAGNAEWYPGQPDVSADEARDAHETQVAAARAAGEGLLCKCMNTNCPNRHWQDVLADEAKAAIAEHGNPVLAADRSTVVATGEGLAIGVRPPGEFHPAVLGILRFFDYHHLRPELAVVSRPFHDLAHTLAETLPPDPETTVALRKLREAKDVAVSLVAIGLPR
jgi:hypothetical protein